MNFQFCNLQVLRTWTTHLQGYLQNHTFVQAKGHRAVSRILPHVLHNLLDNKIVSFAIAWEQLQELSHGERRSRGLTRSVIPELR